jgi:hypothetical protein
MVIVDRIPGVLFRLLCFAAFPVLVSASDEASIRKTLVTESARVVLPAGTIEVSGEIEVPAGKQVSGHP